MDKNKTADIATVVNASEPAVPAAPTREFIEPEISEPVDILAATKFFLQVTGGGDV
ncbi:MAG: hypothetical protein ACRD9S_14360 [Pyrinomonadaceae bacterium]